MPIISTVQDCQVCKELPDTILVQTGISEHFPDAVAQLVRLGLGMSNDIYKCPSCYSLFYWEDRPQFFGSGNLDEQSLTRLSQEGAVSAWALLNLSEECQTGTQLLKQAFENLSQELVFEIVRHLSFTRPLAFSHLVAGLVDRLIETNYCSLSDVLSYYCQMDRKRAEIVSELLNSDPRPKKGYAQSLLSRCAEILGKP
jgi:hypothetical protein